MGMLMVRCPKTGRAISTGRYIESGLFSSTPVFFGSTCCPHCRARHEFVFEAQRHAGILDARLAKQRYMLGDTYTIVDMKVWGWARLIPTVLGDGAWEKFPNLKRMVDEISARPAAQKAMALKDRHKFKTEMDAEAMRAMFPHLNLKVA